MNEINTESYQSVVNHQIKWYGTSNSCAMKPSFFDFNYLALAASQVLAVVEIQYADQNGICFNRSKASSAFDLRRKIIHPLQIAEQTLVEAKPDIRKMEERAIHEWVKEIPTLKLSLPQIRQDMQAVQQVDQGNARLSRVLFTENEKFSIFSITLLEQRVNLLLDKESSGEARLQSTKREKIIKDIFMQPLTAIQCEDLANARLAQWRVRKIASADEATLGRHAQISGGTGAMHNAS